MDAKKKPKYRAIVMAVLAAAVAFFWPQKDSGLLLAQITTPTTADGDYLSPRDAPCIPYVLGPATSTREAIVRGSGPGYLAWVYMSTGNAQDYVAFKDTTALAADGGANGPFELYHASTGDVGTWSFVVFAPPMRFTNGLTAQKSVAGSKITVCTRLYGTQVP